MMNDLLAEMARVGLEPHSTIREVADGKIARFRIRGDKPGSSNGWVVTYCQPTPWACFGSWKTSEQHSWSDRSHARLSPDEQAAIARQRAALREAREREQAMVQLAARAKAMKLWKRAAPADNSHPYLVRKSVGAYGIRRLRDMLLIPARDAQGELHTLQFISADGSKRFLTGGRIAGCYCPIGRPHDSLMVCEGYATAATVFAATGRAVAACFSAGNMPVVGEALRAKFPGLQIVFCADNDPTPGNPGVTAARKAAAAVGGLVVVPNFEGVAHHV